MKPPAPIWACGKKIRRLRIITVNWEADRDNATVVPVGGGAGRVFTVGEQALNAQVQGFYNAVRPDFAPEASLRLQLTFLFPK